VDFETTFIIAIMIIGFVAWRFIPRLVAGVPFVEPGAAYQAIKDKEVDVIIDVRSHGDYIGQGGHVEGAINLPYGYLSEKLRKVEQDMASFKNQPILVTAGTDNLAAHSARLLKKAGFSNLAILKGGMKRWTNMGLPVEHGIPDDAEVHMD
jgi:3-mercaptopyruvate sulfurtransferase SseA